MAQTTDELLAQLERFLPDYYQVMRPVLAGMAAQRQLASEVLDDFSDSVTIGGAENQWLTLLAGGYGVRPANNESDSSIRVRLRNVEPAVTKPAIAAAVNAILSDVGEPPCRVANWWEEDLSCWCDIDSYCGESATGDHYNVFVVFCPLIGSLPGWTSYLGDEDDSYANIDCFCGSTGIFLSPVYDAIIAEVERLRAAGVRWWLIVDYAGDWI